MEKRNEIWTAKVTLEDGTFDVLPIAIGYTTERGKRRATRNAIKSLAWKHPTYVEIELVAPRG